MNALDSHPLLCLPVAPGWVLPRQGRARCPLSTLCVRTPHRGGPLQTRRRVPGRRPTCQHSDLGLPSIQKRMRSKRLSKPHRCGDLSSRRRCPAGRGPQRLGKAVSASLEISQTSPSRVGSPGCAGCRNIKPNGGSRKSASSPSPQRCRVGIWNLRLNRSPSNDPENRV